MVDNYSWMVESLKRYFEKYNFTEGEMQFITNKIRKAIRKTSDNCIDNFRFSVNKDNESNYELAVKNGCCGFYDSQIQLKRGDVIKFGFNYGH